jgi:hypothetical protein
MDGASLGLDLNLFSDLDISDDSDTDSDEESEDERRSTTTEFLLEFNSENKNNGQQRDMAAISHKAGVKPRCYYKRESVMDCFGPNIECPQNHSGNLWSLYAKIWSQKI